MNYHNLFVQHGAFDFIEAKTPWMKREDNMDTTGRRGGESPIDLTVDMDDYNECKRLIARFRAQNPA